MKMITAAAVLTGLAIPAVAQGLPSNPNSKSQGSNVGQASSASTHNGSLIREEGRTGMRDETVQGFHAKEGRGRINSTSSTSKAK